MQHVARYRRWKTAFLCASLPLLALLALGAWQWIGKAPLAAQSADTAPVLDPQAQQSAQSLSKAFRDAAQAVMPAVVKIRTYAKVQQIERRAPRHLPGFRENPFKGTPFEDFFDDRWERMFDDLQPMPRDGLGSGVVIDPSGIVLTNNHVVAGTDDVYVLLPDGREYRATEIRTDPKTDLAVVWFKPDEPLPAARWGDSDSLQIGEWVIAVGHPFELDVTVSAGIISGKARSLRVAQRTDFLQTDAAINPGNSGGPLVNLRGEVVGINTAIASNSGGYQGIGFAVPSNLARWVATQLIQRGSVQRAYLGVVIEELRGDLAAKFGVPHRGGVLVAEVHPNTPAAKADVREGDVITEFAGQPARSPRELQALVERAPLGKPQTIKVLRDGRTLSLQVTLEALPDEPGAARPASTRSGDQDPVSSDSYRDTELGLEVTNLTPDVARRLGFQNHSGVLVTHVDAGGVAYRKGLREGMLIQSVERQPVASVDAFRDALQRASLEQGILLKVRTEEGNRFVVLDRR
jgi:serine protease Do